MPALAGRVAEVAAEVVAEVVAGVVAEVVAGVVAEVVAEVVAGRKVQLASNASGRSSASQSSRGHASGFNLGVIGGWEWTGTYPHSANASLLQTKLQIIYYICKYGGIILIQYVRLPRLSSPRLADRPFTLVFDVRILPQSHSRLPVSLAVIVHGEDLDNADATQSV
jgi:hypothetical protein